MSDEYKFKHRFYYDNKKKVFRTVDYEYGPNYWLYREFTYRTKRLKQKDRIKFYNNHVSIEMVSK